MEIKISDYFSDFFIEGWNLDRNQSLRVEYVNPMQFLKPERLDLVCKLFSIDCREKHQNEDLARELYKEHLRAFSFGTFTEPGSEEKNTLDKYFETFDKLIENARFNGLKADQSVVPVGDNHSILDGSHRTAVAIYYKHPLPVVRIEGVSKRYDYEFFQNRKLKEWYLDFMAYLYILFAEHCYVACLWPRVDQRKKIAKAEALIKETAGIVYRRRIRLNYHELKLLMIQVYGSQKWAGSADDKFKGISYKAKACYRTAAFTTVYVLSGGELKEMVDLKTRIRDVFQLKTHSIHITDTKDEAVEAGQELLLKKLRISKRGKMIIAKSIKNRTYEFLYKYLLLPKNIYFNFRVLPVRQAVKLPFFINYGVKIEEVHKGVIELKSDRISKGMISIGRGGSEGIAVTDKGMISFRAKAKIVFEGTAQFHAGTRLWFDDNARAVFGDRFSANRNFLLYYNDKIRFGKDCMLGWNIRIIDGNAHKVIYEGKERDNKCRIVIGDHVWIGAEVQICRSVSIGNNSIVAYGSTVTGGDFPAHSMIGGYPAKIIKGGVNWRK